MRKVLVRPTSGNGEQNIHIADLLLIYGGKKYGRPLLLLLAITTILHQAEKRVAEFWATTPRW